MNEKTIGEGIQFSDGYVAVLWRNYKRSLKVYKTLDDLKDEDIEEGYVLAWINKNPV